MLSFNRKWQNYLWKLLNATYKSLFCISQKEMFNWNTLFCKMYQLLNTFSRWSQISYWKKALFIPTKGNHKCQLCNQVFAGLFPFRIHKEKLHNAQNVSETKNIDITQFVGKIGDENLKGSSSILPWVYWMHTHGASRWKQCCRSSIMQLKSCFWFCAQDCRRWELSVLLCTRKQHFDWSMKTFGDQRTDGKKEQILNNTDVNQGCTKERANTKWEFHKLKNFTVFAVLLREVPMGCKDAILPKSLTRNYTLFVQLTNRFEENRTMTVYLSLELSLCICMKMGDLRKKLQKSSKSSWKILE